MTCVTWTKTEIMAGPETDAQFLGSIPREVEGRKKRREIKKEEKDF